MAVFRWTHSCDAVWMRRYRVAIALVAGVGFFCLVRHNNNTHEEPLKGTRVFDGSIAEEKTLFTERDYQMFRNVFDWLETTTSECSDLTLLGTSSDIMMEEDTTPGAKWICFDPPMTISDPVSNGSCQAFSIGLYERLVLERSLVMLGCTVYAFDPHQPTIYSSLPQSLHYYSLAVHRNPSKTSNVSWATLDSVIAGLNHSIDSIQYLQIDTGGDESHILMQQLIDNTNSALMLDKAEQISLNVHISADVQHFQSLLSFDIYETSFRRLAAMGYNMVHSRCVGVRRLLYPGVPRAVCAQYEVLLVKSGRDTWDRLERGNAGLRLEYMSQRFAPP